MSFDLERFIAAQDADSTVTRGTVYEDALRELRAGIKITHWMWFIFPAPIEFDRSATSQRFAIYTLAEAVAYLQHPVLGERLTIVNAVVEQRPLSCSLEDMFGPVDRIKYLRSVALFAAVCSAVRSAVRA